MNRFRLRKGQSLFSYIRDSIDIPSTSDLLPIALISKNELVRIVHEPSMEQLEQFSALLLSETHCLCDMQANILSRSIHMPWCHIILAIPNDAPGLVVGGIIMVELLHTKVAYVAALCVRKDFRGNGITSTLFKEFQQMVNKFQWIGFYDTARLHKIRIRPSHFHYKLNNSIQKFVGYAENITKACKQVLDATTEKKHLRLKMQTFRDVAFDNIVDFDARVVGRNRYSALSEIQQWHGFYGVVLVNDKNEQIFGYAIALESSSPRGREFKIGPLYALNLCAAIRLLCELSQLVNEDRMISLYVPVKANSGIQELLEDQALFEMEQEYNRYLTMKANIPPVEHLDNIYVISAQILLPDC